MRLPVRLLSQLADVLKAAAPYRDRFRGNYGTVFWLKAGRSLAMSMI
ncbi:hypothetical protein [Massilia phosphatilytica]